MKKRSKAIVFSLIFLAGIGVGVGAYRLCLLDHEFGDGKDRWLICVIAHKGALRERAELFHGKTGRWPTSVKELVEAHFLPEWSEVHICPSEVGMKAFPRTEYSGSKFVDENKIGIFAHYTSSPYRFRVLRGDFIVDCDYDKKHNRND